MKIIYLVTVFSIPLLLACVPDSNLRDVVLFIYAPFAILYGTFIFFRPNSDLKKLITLAPVTFTGILIIVTTFLLINSLDFFNITIVFLGVTGAALVIALPIGFIFVIVSYGIYSIFHNKGYLE